MLSRAVHASEPGLYMAQRYEDETELLRVAIPVCQIPRAANMSNDPSWRRRCYETGNSTGHEPHVPRRDHLCTSKERVIHTFQLTAKMEMVL